MKTIILFLLLCSIASAQRVSPKHGGVPIPNANDSNFVLTVVSNDSTKIPAWKAVSSGSSLPPYPNIGTEFLAGDSTWKTINTGTASKWYQGDATPPTTAPSVTAGTKGLAAGDSTVASGGWSVAIGSNSLASGFEALAIGGGRRFSGAQATGNYSIAIGADNMQGLSQSINTITIGGTDNSTSQNSDGQHGNNMFFGFSSGGTSASALNIGIGYDVHTGGNGVTVLGANSQCNLTGAGYDAYYGYGVGNNISGDKQYQVFIGNYGTLAIPSTGMPTSQFDSCYEVGAYWAYFRNAQSTVFGNANDTTVGGAFTNATRHLFEVGNGGIYGNAARSNALTVLMNGNVFAGNGFVSGAALGGATTPTNGSTFVDNVIYAWGDIAANGTVNSQYGNCAVSNTGAGTYTITLPTNLTKAVCTITPQALCFTYATYSAGVFTVHTALGTIASPTATNEPFYFIITGRP